MGREVNINAMERGQQEVAQSVLAIAVDVVNKATRQPS